MVRSPLVDDPGPLRSLPAVGTWLAAPELAPLIARHGRAAVTEAIREVLAEARARLREGADQRPELSQVHQKLATRSLPSLRRVINATGVVLHTNLGRAPLAAEARASVLEATGYCGVEFDFNSGERGERHVHVSGLLAELLGTEGGLALNNCAGAVFLMLAALCRDREVIVARSELVEIGGGFRVPDVMAESGARLVEVGTTNKVYAHDYARAITPQTAAILVVHRSNFALVGFTAQPELPALSALARTHNLILLVDQGSGLIATDFDLGEFATQIVAEPRVPQMLAQGADLVAFSGDKLLGGPQAGILAGRAALLERVKRHPLARALRADKLSLAALEATLRLYRDGRARELPVLAQLQASPEALRAKAERLALELQMLSAQVAPSESLPGGGSLPLVRLPTYVVQLGLGAQARALHHHLRLGSPAVIARLEHDRVCLDVRTIHADEIDQVLEAVQAAWRATKSREAS